MIVTNIKNKSYYNQINSIDNIKYTYFKQLRLLIKTNPDNYYINIINIWIVIKSLTSKYDVF